MNGTDDWKEIPLSAPLTVVRSGERYEVRALGGVEAHGVFCVQELKTVDGYKLVLPSQAAAEPANHLGAEKVRDVTPEDCRKVADEVGADQVVVYSYWGGGSTCVATWGRTAADKEMLAAGADRVMGVFADGAKAFVNADFRLPGEAAETREKLEKWEKWGRYILDQKLDDLCWMDLLRAAAEMLGREFKPELLPKAVMLGNCEKYVDSLKAGTGYETPPAFENVKKVFKDYSRALSDDDMPNPEEGHDWLSAARKEIKAAGG